jgi:hypothetical protein
MADSEQATSTLEKPALEDGPVPAEEIAATVLKLLQAQSDPLAPIYLAQLGTQLAAIYTRPLKQVLGPRRLRTLLEQQLSSQIIFEGEPSSLSVRAAASSATLGGQPIRYDKRVWDAFSKQIPPGQIRVLQIERPFSYRDIADPSYEPVESEGLVERDLIPSGPLPRSERDAKIAANIKSWCDTHGQPLSKFRDTSRDEPKRPTLASAQGAEALLNLIEHVPAAERGKFRLPLDLIYRVLKSRQ